MAKVRINVSSEAILNGVRDDCRRCPIARSAWNSFPPHSAIAAFRDELRVRLPHHSSVLKFPLPVEAREFINRFDDGLQVEPFAFDLDIPDEAL